MKSRLRIPASIQHGVYFRIHADRRRNSCPGGCLCHRTVRARIADCQKSGYSRYPGVRHRAVHERQPSMRFLYGCISSRFSLEQPDDRRSEEYEQCDQYECQADGSGNKGGPVALRKHQGPAQIAFKHRAEYEFQNNRCHGIAGFPENKSPEDRSQ